MSDEIPPPPVRPPPLFAPGEGETQPLGGHVGTAAGTTGLPPNVAAGLACVVPPISSVVFLVLEKKDPFVRFWAMQSLIVGAISILASFVLTLVAAIFAPIPILHGLVVLTVILIRLVLSLGFLVVWILMLVKSFGGQEWEVPIIGRFAREQLAKLKF